MSERLSDEVVVLMEGLFRRLVEKLGERGAG